MKRKFSTPRQELKKTFRQERQAIFRAAKALSPMAPFLNRIQDGTVALRKTLFLRELEHQLPTGSNLRVIHEMQKSFIEVNGFVISVQLSAKPSVDVVMTVKNHLTTNKNVDDVRENAPMDYILVVYTYNPDYEQKIGFELYAIEDLLPHLEIDTIRNVKVTSRKLRGKVNPLLTLQSDLVPNDHKTLSDKDAIFKKYIELSLDCLCYG